MPCTPQSGARVAICAAGELWGGVEQCLLTLARGLASTGHAPQALLFYDGPLAHALRHAGVETSVYPGGPKYDPRLVSWLRGRLRCANVNLLHVHGYKATIVGGFATRGSAIRVVKTEHGQVERPAKWTDFPGYARLRMNNWLDGIVTRSAVDATAFVSRDLQRHARPWRHGRPVRLIHNGIDPPAPTDALPGWAQETAFHIGIVGRIDAVKGHGHLIAAIERLSHLRDLRLHVFGTGPLEADYRARVSAAGLDRVIHFHGFQRPIQPHLAALRALVMPSLHEGLPYALLEAMQLGVPVIASRVGGLPEVLNDGCGVLVEPRDETALARAIEQLYHDASLRARLAQRARRKVTERFQAADMVRAYAALYADLVS
jgi:glycosyltransferase involved in cell wall biosynthesis